MAILKLQNLTFYPSLGIHDYEQHAPNKIEVSITIEGDNLIPQNNTPILDYAKIHDTIKKIVYSKKHQLIETLAQEILTELKKFTTSQKVTIELCKYPKFLSNGKACIIISE